ncbi:MAG: Hsp20/alpha crystallin family protein [Burkholderiaceae bacterium]|nr:Hsp20/alpha crystallin family protein [Burkholderiaceae bacterium]
MIFVPVIRRSALAHAPRQAHPTDLALQRFLLGALHNPAAARPATTPPAACTVAQGEQATTLQLDVPGLARDALDITIEGAVVRVQSVPGAARTVQRAFELPHAVDAQASRAQLENGVLTLTLAHQAPQSQVTPLTVH